MDLGHTPDRCVEDGSSVLLVLLDVKRKLSGIVKLIAHVGGVSTPAPDEMGGERRCSAL